jgi:hypothetical protein
LPYDTTVVPPMAKTNALRAIEAAGERSRAESLESFCQIAAGFILVPRRSLRQVDTLGEWARWILLIMYADLPFALRSPPR